MPSQADVMDLGQSLALAVVTASTSPVLLLDGEFLVVAASESFCATFELDAPVVIGNSLFNLGTGEWDVRTLRALLESTRSGQVKIASYEMDLVRPDRKPRRLALGAQTLAYGDAAHLRVLLTVSDLTAARHSERLRDDLLREREILLQELQHRVANSLQIIASILMQSARQVQSEETRGHLTDAHNRVMSIAAVQQQLSASQQGSVEITPYFRQLCKSLAASMIRDPEHIVLAVNGDSSMVDADDSVSLGLVVTELVINALKHAFPEHRKGDIDVGYASKGEEWTLTVSDDGVGMPSGRNEAKAGLGSSIVEALAKHLEATVVVTDAHPGTRVSLSHSPKTAGSNRLASAI